MKPKLLIITPVNHISGFNELLKKNFKFKILENPSYKSVLKIIHKYDAIFTNPNKSKVLIDKNIINIGKNLKCVCTASTGTNHIDIEYLKKNSVRLLSLKNERSTINKISSTAEHAVALTLSHLRNVSHAYEDVKKKNWDYTKFIGRQLSSLNVGIVGLGRLGKFYAKFMSNFSKKIYFFDPYKKSKKIKKIVSLKKLFQICDIISLHVHVSKSTMNLIDKKILSTSKKDLLLINTARGEIINEKDLIKFLVKNPNVKYATDVVSNEIINKNLNFLKEKKIKNQILITPHIGGMTREAQEIAYIHSLKRLITFFKKINS